MHNQKNLVKTRTQVSNEELESALDEYAVIKNDMDKLFSKFKEVGFETTVSK